MGSSIMPAKNITILTGAGISAESGIPTFRGPEGYWTVGSREYRPQEMATYAMFCQYPEEVWKWYLYRLGVCQDASPNDGHKALVELETYLQDRFTLVTQNVDGLHLVAGNSLDRTYQIHGNVYYMRCADECQTSIYPLPLELLPREKDQPITTEEKDLLSCPDCHARTRPHVLWFDEMYNEHYFRFDSAMQAAILTDLLIVAGTSGATTLPNHIAKTVLGRGKPVIDVNIEENPFSEMAKQSNGGRFIQDTCSNGLQEITELIKKDF